MQSAQSVGHSHSSVKLAVICTVVDYSKQYLNLVQDDYKVVWWKLFNAFDSKNWSNFLAVVELLICLPIANGRVERVFSLLKLINTNRRTCLKEDTLDHLLRINAEGPSLSEWDSSRAVKLWLSNKTCTVNHRDSRAQPTTSASTRVQAEEEESSSDSENPTFSLDNWEEWISHSEI